MKGTYFDNINLHQLVDLVYPYLSNLDKNKITVNQLFTKMKSKLEDGRKSTVKRITKEYLNIIQAY